MSELEREELISRIKGMSDEEKRLTASALPSEILAIEVGIRMLQQEQKISNMAKMLR